MLLIGGGSGMSPLWSILADHIASGEQRPVHFFYGARTRAICSIWKRLAAMAAQLKDFKFIPALSHAEADDGWDGETGFVHEVVSAPSARGGTRPARSTPTPAGRRR